MKIAILTAFFLGVVGFSQSAIIEPSQSVKANKIFNYQGAMLIKDDRTGELIRDNSNDTEIVLEEQQNLDEAACWNLIVERSGKS